MYLSVAGNVRYYGLLQTVGMTGRQIRSLIRRQMLFLGGAGTAGGILLGGIVSFLLLPSVIRSLGIRTGMAGEVEGSLNPWVLLLTAALDQIRKDKRKAAVIMVSLAAGMSVFLCVTTLLESQGARTIVTNHMDNDLTIVNDTLKKEDAKEHKDLLTESFLDDLKSVSGVAEIYPLSYGQITVPWEPDFAEMWMEETYAKWMNIPYEKEREEYKEHPENFGAVMIGISEEEFPYLQQTVETEIDREDFLEGKTCVIYRNDLDLTCILNYVNTVTGNIQSRKTELAILESVGMTDRQRKRMLVTEGLIFAVGSLLITATAGLVVTYAVYQSMNYMQVPFVVPVWPVVGMAVFITAVCAGIPVIAGAGMVHKGSVVERVRGV